jgi:hypothetical protein
MALPSATEVDPIVERPSVGRRRLGRRLFGLATPLAVGAACLLVGTAAGRPVAASLSEACDPNGPAPGKAAARVCAGLTLPKETVEFAGAANGVVTLTSPFAGVDITHPVNHAGACNVEGAACVYHHWNWGGSLLEFLVVAGCGANDKTCKISLHHNGFNARWAIVTVQLDDNNQGNEVAIVVSTNAPPPKTPDVSLSVALSSSAPSWKLAVGASANVTARVTAVGGSVGSIALGLTKSGSAVSVTSQPSGAKGFSLAKGSSRSFTYRFKGLAGGKSTVVASAGGKTAAGKTVKGSDSAELVVGAAGPTAIDWEMAKRTTTAEVESLTNGADGLGLPTAAWVNPDHWTATLFTRTDTGRYECTADTRFVWSVKPVNLLVDGKQPRAECDPKLNVTQQGTLTVSAQMQTRTGGAWRDSGKPITGKVRVKDWLVVGMGDSNGSGEGDPPFFFKRCNRSLSSYQVQTALDLESKDPHTSVTFIFSSCSGARVEHLWHTDYGGTRRYNGSGLIPSHPDGPPLPPQIDQVKALLDDHGVAPARKVDAALISIGVNDLSFGPVLTYCIKHGAEGLVTVTKDPCENTRVSAVKEPGTLNGVAEFVDAPKGTNATSETLNDWVDIKHKALVGYYGNLAKRLPELGVKSNRVFMAQYPDFAHGADGKLCGYDGVARFPTVTWGWLSGQSVLLNDSVKTGAMQHHWIVPEWDKTRFLKAGYCAPLGVALIRNVVDALGTNDIGGPFHPTPEGADVEKQGTITTVCEKLYNGDATCNEPKVKKG